MSYVAMHFVKINGRMYTEGEIISEAMEESKKQRLLEHGAIREIAPAPEAAESRPLPEEPVKRPAKKAAKPAAPVEDAEADEDAEVPEIDVMDGIVGARKRNARRKA